MGVKTENKCQYYIVPEVVVLRDKSYLPEAVEDLKICSLANPWEDKSCPCEGEISKCPRPKPRWN